MTIHYKLTSLGTFVHSKLNNNNKPMRPVRILGIHKELIKTSKNSKFKEQMWEKSVERKATITNF